MTEEEYFRKNNPDFCYGNRLLSPYWDLFQDGVEFGERQSEKKIADLEETNAILSESASINQKDLEYKVSVIEQRNKKIAEQRTQLTKAKEIIQNIIRITWGEGWNYSLDWKVKAEQFLKEIEK